MKRHRITGMLVFTGLFASTVLAQERARVIAPDPGHPGPLPPIDFRIEMLGVEPFEMGESVEQAPYSADIVTEVTQELTDGNRIEQRTTGAVARDSRGRVRREHQLSAIGPVVPEGEARMVTIYDPVAGVHYSLDPARKVAIRSRPPRLHAELPGAVFASAGMGPEVGLAIRGGPEPLDVHTEQLGTKMYEGLRAEGTRSVSTLRAGAIGNVRPIEIVSERWYSPELRVLVEFRRADPRFGETTYRLMNITRTEPDALLFQVPADYTREEMKPPSLMPPIDR